MRNIRNILYALLLVSSYSIGADIPESAIRTKDVDNICSTKTSSIRDVSQKKKKQVYKNGGIPYGDKAFCRYGYEVDHIISLCAGGSNDISNLQLQSYCKKDEMTGNYPATILFDAHGKDKLERRVCTNICNGKISVEDGQKLLWEWKEWM